MKKEYGRGIEVACLDAAKSVAGLVWDGKGSAQDPYVLKRALTHLPTDGSLAKSQAILSLRLRITDIIDPTIH